MGAHFMVRHSKKQAAKMSEWLIKKEALAPNIDPDRFTEEIFVRSYR